MSASVNVTIPQVSQQNGSQLEIVGFDVVIDPYSVGQWPYIPTQDSPCTASQSSVAIYGDTVTINGDLINPGQDIAIYARQLIIGPTTFINTSAPDPVTNYPALQPATDTNTTPGAAGANGAAGSNNIPAGNITLAVGEIVVAGSDLGAGTIGRQISQRQALASTFEQLWIDGSPIFNALNNLNIGSMSYSFTDHIYFIFEWTLNWTISMPSTTFSGIKQCAGITSTYANNQLTLNVDLGPLTVTSPNTEITLNGRPFTAGSLEIMFTLSASFVFDIGSDNVSITPAGNSYAINDLQVLVTDPQFNINSPICLGSDAITAVTANLQNALNSASSGIADALTAIATGIATAYLLPDQGTPGLVLMANGGIGGRGQDGGTGVPGNQGSNNGNGGNGGTTGNGSNGGAITMFMVEQPTIGIAATSAAGLGDIVSLPGAGVTGGGYNSGMGLQGAPGSNGTAGSASLNGASLSAPFSQVNYTAFGGNIPISQLLIEQQGAKLAFISAEVPVNGSTLANYQAVIALYQWLYNVTTAPSANPVDANTRTAINQAAQVALGRIRAGLTYYGTPVNWTPVLTVSNLAATTNELLGYLGTIETAYQTASVANTSQQVQQAAAMQAITQVQNDIANMTQQLQTAKGQVASLVTSLESLDAQLDTAVTNVFAEIQSDEKAYMATIDQFDGCTWADIQEGFKGIVAIGTGVASAEEDIVGAAQSIAEGVGDIIGAANDAIANIQTAENDWASVQAAWNTLVNDFNGNASNSAIAIDEQTFDSLLNTYFGQAGFTGQLLTDVNNLVTLAQTRNQSRLTLTALCAQVGSLTAEIAQKQNYIDYIEAANAGKFTPNLTDYVAFLLNSYNALANEVVDNLWLMNQALTYWNLNPLPLQISDISPSALTLAMNNLVEDIQTTQTSLGSPASSYQNMTYTFDAQNDPEIFAQLANNQVVMFTLAPSDADNPFTKDSFVSVGSMEITIAGPGMPSTFPAGSSLSVAIGQTGPDTRINQINGTATEVSMTFSHMQVDQTYQFNLSTNKVSIVPNFGDNTTYTMISPFAPWILDFTNSTIPGIDWSNITSITLTLSGTLYGPAPKPVNATKESMAATA